MLVFISEDFYFLSHRQELLLGLQKCGHEIHLVTNLCDRETEVRKTGIPVHHVDLDRKSLSPMSLLRGALAYRRVVRSVAPDVLFAVALKPILAAAICRFWGIRQPLLCAFAGLGAAFAGNSKNLALRSARFGMEQVFRPLLNHDRCYCLFQNGDDAELFWSRKWTTRERSHVVQGAGIVLQDFAPKTWESGRPVSFIFVGRLLWDKGIGELAEACRLLRRRNVPFGCRVVGLTDSTNKSAVPVAFMETQERAGILEWCGARHDVPDLMRQADCFVFPSKYREGIPKVLLEACAAGLPIITTDMPGCRDVVRNGYNGLLIPPNDPVKLAEAMEKCITDREQLKVWGANARREAEVKYGVDYVIERHLEILSDISRRHQL